ncbi:MAG: twin-arginine translocase TatA/TatE family subunit [Anaerolineaceae bacterium]|nr:twin-arginine translocase TatA/TatE family subunit [Anaerolineaceae bacterium]
MRGFGWQELLIVLAIVLVLFGGRLSKVAGEMASGIKAFRKNIKDDDDVADTSEASSDK